MRHSPFGQRWHVCGSLGRRELALGRLLGEVGAPVDHIHVEERLFDGGLQRGEVGDRIADGQLVRRSFQGCCGVKQALGGGLDFDMMCAWLGAADGDQC